MARTVIDPGETPVVVTCVPGDLVAWLVDQYDITPLVEPAPEPAAVAPGLVQGSLTELGLLDPEATLEDWMVRVPLGRVLTASVGGTAGDAAPLRRAA